MLKLVLVPQAIKDLEDIYEYTFLSWGENQADKYQDELFLGMQLILSNENIGELYLSSKFKYRRLLINRHLLFYRIEKRKCIVVRILHERMNLNNHLI